MLQSRAKRVVSGTKVSLGQAMVRLDPGGARIPTARFLHVGERHGECTVNMASLYRE